jgi:hypothetical protein
MRDTIFLSHSGLDAPLVIQFANDLRSELRFRLGENAPNVFNTSEAEYRHKELKDLIASGDSFREKASKYDEELKQYLEEHLSGAALYILLATPRSLKASSAWIEFEMRTAYEKVRKEPGIFFLPCVADGAKLSDLPEPAIRFHGMETNDLNGTQKLADRITEVIKEQKKKSIY